jgi:O-antigen/teichoic acid export membrane protein
MWFSRLNRAINRTLLFAFIAQAMQYSASLLLIPFLVTRLSAEEVGIWYVFIAVQGLAFVTDFGFQPTFTRAFAAAHAGATHLIARGLGDAVVEGGGANNILVGQIISAARIFYAMLAGVVLLLLLACGLPYVTALVRHGHTDLASAQIAWAIFAVGIALNLLVQWIGPALMGGGRIIASYQFIIVNRLGFAMIGIATLIAGGGLIGLAVSQIAAQAIALITVLPALRKVKGARDPRPDHRNGVHEVLKTVWPNASRMGTVAIGGFLITRFSMFAVSNFAGLAVVGTYAISLQILSAVNGVAQMPMQVAMPQLVAARVARDRQGLKRMFLISMGMFLALFIFGTIAAVVIVPKMLLLTHSQISLLPVPIMLLLAAIIMLEGFHSNAAFFITTANEVPFMWPAIISGVAVATSMTMVGWLGGGVAEIIMCQGIVQLLYNNWRWPQLAWKDIKNNS